MNAKMLLSQFILLGGFRVPGHDCLGLEEGEEVLTIVCEYPYEMEKKDDAQLQPRNLDEIAILENEWTNCINIWLA